MAFLPSTIWINAHDTIRWRANAAEVHTVTFLASGQTLASMQPFNPFDPKEAGRVGGSVYDGTSYFNSGAMSNASGAIVPTTEHYRLTFPEVGVFTYWCLVHGVMMKGTVHVRPVGTQYPYTQRQYDRQGFSQSQAILRDGFHLWKQTAEGATNHLVLAGNVDTMAMVMRFVRPTVVVHVGQKVVFENIGMAAPHTVTFGKEPANPFLPVGDPTTYSGGQLNSGVMRPGSHFTVTFTKAGTYRYICALHDFMGMVGKVVVTP
jgi:plastocyanin